VCTSEILPEDEIQWQRNDKAQSRIESRDRRRSNPCSEARDHGGDSKTIKAMEINESKTKRKRRSEVCTESNGSKLKRHQRMIDAKAKRKISFNLYQIISLLPTIRESKFLMSITV